MQRKKLFLVALILLVVGAGMFFIGRTTGEPLAVAIIGTTRQPDGTVNITLTVSNQTERPGYFFAYPLILSHGNWRLDDGAGKPIGVVQNLSAHGRQELTVRASDRAGQRRLQLKYDVGKSPRREQIDRLLAKIGLGTLWSGQTLRDFATPPFDVARR